MLRFLCWFGYKIVIFILLPDVIDAISDVVIEVLYSKNVICLVVVTLLVDGIIVF